MTYLYSIYFKRCNFRKVKTTFDLTVDILGILHDNVKDIRVNVFHTPEIHFMRANARIKSCVTATFHYDH